MDSREPSIEVRLWTNPVCYLSNQVRFSLVVHITLHDVESVTFVKHSDDVESGLVNLLMAECIECFDMVSNEKIPVFGDAESISRDKIASASTPLLMSLRDNRASYVTFTTDTKPREYEFVLDPSRLQPGRKYTIQCTYSSLDWWSRSSLDDCLAHFKAHGELPSTEVPPLQCKVSNKVTFECRQKLSEPPRVDVHLSAAPILSLSGNVPFNFSTTFVSHATRPITVLAERNDKIADNNDVEIVDAKSGIRVAPDLIDVNDDGSWAQDDFLTLEPERPYVEERVLEYWKAGLDGLRLDTDYILRFPKDSWRWWSFDSIDEVMRYAGDRGSWSLGSSQPIDLICNDEVKLYTVG